MAETIKPVRAQSPAASHATLRTFPPVGKKGLEGSPVNEVQDRPQYSANVHVCGKQSSAAPLLVKRISFVREKRQSAAPETLENGSKVRSRFFGVFIAWQADFTKVRRGQILNRRSMRALSYGVGQKD